MTTVVLATVGVVAGVLGVVVACWPARPHHDPAAPWPQASGTADPVSPHPGPVAGATEAVLGRPALARLVGPWLAITETPATVLAARSARAGVVGAAAGTAVGALAVVAGGGGAGSAVLAVVLGAAGGAVVPAAVLRRDADRQRGLATQAVGTYLDLVVMCLAGGMGVESALDAAASVADDHFSRRIARALRVAATAGRPPWDTLGELGERLGIPELAALAATVGLAGTEGARVRASLVARAESLRARQLADAEAQANVVTERLFVPGVLLLLGFLLFIGYPAVARILSGL